MSDAIKKGSPDHPIHELLVTRWSPYSYADRSVPEEDLRALFEAARWAASSYNEQPWRYIVARREDAALFQRVLGCLVEGNRAWAQYASALAIGIYRSTFELNGKPNKAACHDLGLAAGNICLEAAARGIHVHQMIGIEPDKVRSEFNVPGEYEPYTALAFGYHGPREGLDPALAARDDAPRTRKPLAEFVFGEAWGVASPIV